MNEIPIGAPCPDECPFDQQFFALHEELAGIIKKTGARRLQAVFDFSHRAPWPVSSWVACHGVRLLLNWCIFENRPDLWAQFLDWQTRHKALEKSHLTFHAN